MKYVIILAVVMACGLGALSFKLVASRSNTSSQVAFPSEPPPAGSKIVHGFGYLEPAGEVRRLQFRAIGVIGTVHVAVGDRVRQEQPLMSLHDESLRAELSAAEAALTLAKAEQAKTLSGAQEHEIAAAQQQVAL